MRVCARAQLQEEVRQELVREMLALRAQKRALEAEQARLNALREEEARARAPAANRESPLPLLVFPCVLPPLACV